MKIPDILKEEKEEIQPPSQKETDSSLEELKASLTDDEITKLNQLFEIFIEAVDWDSIYD